MDIYREHILDHWKRPRNFGKLDDPNVVIDETNPLCGDALHFELKVEDGAIKAIAFQGEGCAISVAAASLLTEKAKRQSVKNVLSISNEMMLKELGISLSPTRLRCGLLAISGLRKGLKT